MSVKISIQPKFRHLRGESHYDIIAGSEWVCPLLHQSPAGVRSEVKVHHPIETVIGLPRGGGVRENSTGQREGEEGGENNNTNISCKCCISLNNLANNNHTPFEADPSHDRNG